MAKQWTRPAITEHLVVHRAAGLIGIEPATERAAGWQEGEREREGLPEECKDTGSAVDLFDFVRRNVDSAALPALARAVSILTSADRVPLTLGKLARVAGTSRTTLWREWHAFGLDGVSQLTWVRSGLVWRVEALLRAGMDARDRFDYLPDVRQRAWACLAR